KRISAYTILQTRLPLNFLVSSGMICVISVISVLWRCSLPRTQISTLLMRRFSTAHPLFHLNSIDMSHPAHIGTEYDPLHIGRECDVGFECVIVPGQVDQLFDLQCAVLRREEIDPLAVAGSGYAVRASAVAGEELPVGRGVEMHRPTFALHSVLDLFALRNVVSGQPEFLRCRRLQVVPDGFAVGAEELMAGDFHLHRSGMNLLQPRPVRANRPDAVDFVPWPFVTEHQQSG